MLAAISDDDPELSVILAGIKTPVVSINQMIEAGPHKRTVIYDNAKPYADADGGDKGDCTGLLRTWTSMGRRHAFALDYAKYLLALKILGEEKNKIRLALRARGRAAELSAATD